jgi:superfamily I DNA/RNA helicase/mRNA-degrading endonuclease RelE of RelBE toxin-antitoxin system
MTTWNEIMTKEFWKDFNDLPSDVTQRTKHSIDRMLQDPWAPELHPEKVKAAESGVHSCRVDDNYRIIWKDVKPNNIVFLLVDKHNEAYRRATRKSFTLVDGVVRIADIIEVGAKPAQVLDYYPDHKPENKFGKLFVGFSDKEIISWGVPAELLSNIRSLDDADELAKFEHSSEISGPVFDQLLTIALGVVERPIVPDEKLVDSLERNQGGEDIYRFVDTEEFKRVLEGGMEEWMLFLAPFQRALTIREYNGPSRLRGVAGSGKTVIALHRARFLTRKVNGMGKKVLFLTYGNRLPGVMRHLFEKLMGVDCINIQSFECLTIHQLCQRLLTKAGHQPKVNDKLSENALAQAIISTQSAIHMQALFDRPLQFFQDEIKYAIKGRCVSSLAQYLKLNRSGRGTALNPKERAAMYTVYEVYQKALNDAGICDWDDFILYAIKAFDQGKIGELPYSHIIVDEIQDLTESTMQLIRRLVPQGKNDLFLVGDGMQRIYAGGYSLANLGIDVVGRSSLLYKNYRNTQQILRAAHSVIKDVVLDDMEVDESESVEPEYSVRQGENPLLKGFLYSNAELQWVAQEIGRLTKDLHYKKGDIAILYRHISPYKENILSTLNNFSLPSTEITKDPLSYFGDTIKLTTFHSAKGLEFKVVFVVGVTDGQYVPRDDWTREGEELLGYLENEKRLLYVAMTRARDLLYLTYSRGQPSRFLAQVPQEYLKQ